jgi:hypothetical protein
MWESRRLTTLWASTACYRNKFTFFLRTPRSWALLRSRQLRSHLIISWLLWDPKVHSRVYNSIPPVGILSQITPVHTTPSYLSKIQFNIIPRLCLGLPSGLFPSGLPPKIYTHYSSLLCVLHALPISSSSTCRSIQVIKFFIIKMLLINKLNIWSVQSSGMWRRQFW